MPAMRTMQLIALLGPPDRTRDAGGGRAYRRLLDLDPKSATGLAGTPRTAPPAATTPACATLRPALADPGNALAQALAGTAAGTGTGRAAARAWFEELNQARCPT